MAIQGATRTYDLARRAIASRRTLEEVVMDAGFAGEFDLPSLAAQGLLLAPIDHPDPAHLLVTGTGLTHLGSANARDAMHQGEGDGQVTDSMKMFRMGIEGGKPAVARKGVQPEWFYKGSGHTIVPPGAPLRSPAFALDGGEEPEIAGIYVIDDAGAPFRLGFALANEFSDHVTEKQNYLYLAHSKLRQSSIGPELLVGALPPHVEGMSRIRRNGEVVWEKPFLSGEANMSHTIANLEYHHFKYAAFRRPGDIHVHMFGTATLSFSDGIAAREGDCFEISASGFGLPLSNTLQREAEEHVDVRALY